ncbi:MAG: hypothetical protein A3C85_02610 [Candidatus Doudnabacteria bacterium RIFCSPHIGHO2_02_FULL_48_21]|uniref:CYTH domain-containing protein n=1 Tax=Candidatus Doudnabacteria bacterium RIFCSPLOWO2_02_FULL_48_13 TaxID=1817845 RepID=A0A1F5QAZ5_9BACT|nr:MAG: hypothetical protein A3K05_03890 [Candidatus Doudnabacteria bacterium RIFCSPHIGHO2_01_48_18]OGE91410.1 MAG: hypothetical protein A3F44_00630 [Candidatus Doudnabacteria bacterium RIFCSPHIGHO2_12_FULL_47_25]OGE93895.1 MAG: hypothetical protein A3C85_02610 [Candidatus Doudnabacteria bacterium RIFCSPHIGHO2_02_FULL_48_21]OGE99328.1 MAG: hypothetical protein A3J05_00210 [Candidatus Doudnabacteria bacterium RIFCSPLOWO2_02_FULL_48_13]OGF01705.1 MAG: hypothetical protein A3G07_01255 [Candidatus 
MKKALVLFFAFLFVFQAFVVSAQDDVRIEDDFNLAYPEGNSDEIFNYLKSRYVDDNREVRNLGLDFSSSYGDEDFTDTYFDTRNLDLYQRKGGLRYRVRSDRLDSRAHKELVQLKLSGDDKLADTGNVDSRNEIKFEMPEGSAGQPSLTRLTAGQTDELKLHLTTLGVDYSDLRPILTIQQRRRRVYINRNDATHGLNNATFISFSVDDAQSQLWTRSASFSQMEVELNEMAYTGADDATRLKMQELQDTMIRDLKDHFNYLEDDTTIKYTKMFDLLEDRLPFLKWLAGNNLNNEQGMFAAVGLPLILLGGLVYLVVKGLRPKPL